MTPLGPRQPDDPALLGGFTITGVLGQGGMGRVYLAQRVVRERVQKVALKLIRLDSVESSQMRAQFVAEARAAMAIASPFVARVVALDLDGSPQWLATEYIAGPTLADYVHEHGPLPERLLTVLAHGLAEGIRAVSDAGVVHGDITPANIVLGASGPVLVDLGASRRLAAPQDVGGRSTFATPGWMAPEIRSGQPGTGASDVFGWGAVLAFAATGQALPAVRPAQTESIPRSVDGLDLSSAPAWLYPLATRCLDPDPSVRPGVAELAAALSTRVDSTAQQAWAATPWTIAAAAGPSGDASLPGTPPRYGGLSASTVALSGTADSASRRPGRRALAVLVVLAAAVVAAVVAGGVLLSASPSSQNAASTPSTTFTTSPSTPTSPNPRTAPSPQVRSVELQTGADRPVAGTRIRLTAAVTPPIPGLTVTFQSASGTTWTDIAKARTGAGGRASADVLVMDSSGVARFRAGVLDGDRTLVTVSPVTTIRMRPATTTLVVDWPQQPITPCAQVSVTAKVRPPAAGRRVALQSSDTEEVWGDVTDDVTGPKGIAILPLPDCDTQVGAIIGSQRWRVVVDRSPAYLPAESDSTGIAVRGEEEAPGACTTQDTDAYLAALETLNTSNDPESLDSAAATVQWYESGCPPR